MLAIVGYFCRWLFVITMAVLYNYFLIIVRETFDPLNDNILPLWIVLDYTADVIYIVDMFVQMFTSESYILTVCYKVNAGHIINFLTL